MRADARRGAVLLEVLIAMTILAVAGGAIVALMAGAGTTVRAARAREADVMAASAFVDRVSLWSAEELDRHLGERAQGPWRMDVGLTEPGVYQVAVRDSLTDAVLVATALYRPSRHRMEAMRATP